MRNATLTAALLAALCMTTAPLLAAPSSSPSGHRAPAAAPLGDYVLTAEKLELWAKAVRAASDAIRAHPELEDAASMDASDSRDASVARLEAQPVIKRAIEGAGMSVGEYVDFTTAFMQAVMAQAALDQGLLKEAPAEVNPKNLAFVRSNKARIEALLKELQAESDDSGGA